MADLARRRLLVVGQAGSPTGFARVTTSILEQLPASDELHLLGLDLREGGEAANCVRHANPDPDDPFGQRALPGLLARLQPDLVLVIGELWSTLRHHGCLLAPGRRFRTVLYAAIAHPRELHPDAIRRLPDLDLLVVYTDHARALIERMCAEQRAATPEWIPPRIEQVGHGLDTNRFFPVADVGRARAEVFGDQLGAAELDEAFVVLNANRNQPHKRIELSIAGFARFAAGAGSHVKLCLHMSTRPPAPGERSAVDRYGVRDRLLLTGPPNPTHPELTVERLNLLYNACDVGINTAEAEGWGLVAFEHAATGAAQIVPGYGACRELWADKATLLELPDPQRWPSLGPPREQDIEVVAQALAQLHRSRELRERVARACYANATAPDRSWAAVGRRWHAILSQFEPLV